MRGISRVVGGVFALAMVSALAPLARAQSTEVIPPTNATVNGGSGNIIPLATSSGGGAYQVLYEPSQLVGLPIGGRITSIRLRQWNIAFAAWPPAAAVCTDYEIRLGTSTRTAATISTTFADNITSAVLVRDGALNLAANAYPGGAATGTTPEGWGPVIAFSTPYTYTGGPLVIEFRNNGTGVTGSADTVTLCPSAAGVGNTSAQTATIGFVTPPLVVLLGIEPPNTQQVTLPNANDTVAGNSDNSIPIGAFSDGRHMSLYAADQFASVPPGSIITGMQLRLRNAEASGWPGADSTNSDYTITLSQSPLTPATMNNTYASNQTNPVTVRSGSYLVPAGVYPAGANSGGTPEGWGPVIDFQTPYVYQGGALAIDIQSAGGIAPVKFCDAVTTSAAATGKTASPRASATGAGNSAFIVRLSYVPPVESPFGDGVTKIYALKDYAGTPAPSNQAVLSFISPYASEFVYSPEQFQTVGPGTLLTALSLRNNDPTAWPPAPTTATSYSIELSKSLNGPATLSITITNNIGADNITARSGPLSVATGEMAAAPTNGTAPFTWQIPFSTPYSYRSGSLLGVFRNSGFATAGEIDAIAFNAPEVGVQTKGFFGAPDTAVTISFVANIPVMRFSADAQVIVPNSIKDGTGLGGSYFANSPYSGNEATFQYIVGASQLSYIPVGGLITSMSLLADTSEAGWPGVGGAEADDLSVEISTAKNRPTSMSLTYADNTGNDALIVRSGPISWLPGALPAGSTGKYGGTITFDRAFVYTGGDLCITVRHSPILNGGPTLRAANPAAATRAVRSSGKTATTGSFFGVDAGAAIQLGYVPTDVTPRSARNSDGTTGSRFLFAGTRAYQMLYDADQVGVPVGATINGVSFRIDNEAPSAAFFPAADFTNDRFDITMSTATNSAANMSTTFANNEGSDLTTVRSGPIAIPKGAYPSFSPQRPFGLFIPFTRPFVYKGGPLTMLIRSGTTSGAATDVLFDSTDTGAAGVRNIGNANALSGSTDAGGIIARFAFTDDAFCPWDLNNDGVVNDDDFQIFVLSYNILDCADPTMPLGCPSDFTFDRIVNDDDFLPFVQAYNDLLCP
jgi:hypothetical protein